MTPQEMSERILRALEETDYIVYKAAMVRGDRREALAAYFGPKLPALEARYQAEQ